MNRQRRQLRTTWAAAARRPPWLSVPCRLRRFGRDVRDVIENRQNTPAVMFVWLEMPLPEKVWNPLIDGPLRLDGTPGPLLITKAGAGGGGCPFRG